MRQLLERRAAAAHAEAAITAVHSEVYAGAYEEGLTTGQVPPVAAVLARIEASQRARGLDYPVKPPELV